MSETKTQKKIILFLSLVLILSTTFLYFKTFNYDFIEYDDTEYVSRNSEVQKGIKNIIWAFTSVNASIWHPLTMLSFLADYELFGLNAGGYHLSNLFYHTLATLFLFFLLLHLTKKIPHSFFITIIFALHPMHIESVAWISERKDVLSTLFALLSIYFYSSYSKEKNYLKYSLSLLFFILSLFSKPMFVTLPFCFMLFDIWPLKRVKSFFSFKLFLEKLPFFILSIVISIITFYIQKTDGAVVAITAMPFWLRFSNIFVSYATYLYKFFLPFNLSIFYPYPKYISIIKFLSSFSLIAVFSYLAFKLKNKKPYFFIGWFLFLGTLVPVIGIVRVGLQGMADRYTYFPYIGLSIIIVFSVFDFFDNYNRCLSYIALVSIVLFLGFLSFRHIPNWQNSKTIFLQATKATKNNYFMHNNVAIQFENEGNIKEALKHYNISLKLEPTFGKPYNNIASLLINQNRFDEAEKVLKKLIKVAPDYPHAYANLGALYHAQGKTDLALNYYLKSTKLVPELAQTHNNIAQIYMERKEYQKALNHFNRALEINPFFAKLNYNIATLFEITGYLKRAVYYHTKALEIDKNFTPSKKRLESLKNLNQN